MERWRLKSGDNVIVIAGKNKGAKGKVTRVLRDERKVVVEGVNICVKHVKPSMNSAGGIEKKEMPIHASNVMLLDPTNDMPTRVGVKFVDGKKVRFSKRTGAIID
jgi:large subunit ribosomal protein L24